jgi:hypothetical protein
LPEPKLVAESLPRPAFDPEAIPGFVTDPGLVTVADPLLDPDLEPEAIPEPELAPPLNPDPAPAPRSSPPKCGCYRIRPTKLLLDERFRKNDQRERTTNVYDGFSFYQVKLSLVLSLSGGFCRRRFIRLLDSWNIDKKHI